MPDELTDNLGLTKISRRKGWADAYNDNMDALGVLHYIHTDGSMFICKNAVYRDGAWIQPDTNHRSSLIQIQEDGSFVLSTCAQGNASITWTQVASFGSEGSLTLPSGLTVTGNISATGTIAGDISAYLLLSLLSINADKNWNAKDITNLGSLNILKAVSTAADTTTRHHSLASSISTQSETYLLADTIIVPGGYSPFDTNTFRIKIDAWISGQAYGAYAKFEVNGVQVYENSTTSTSPVTFSYDAELSSGDVITVYYRNTAYTTISYFQNIKITNEETLESFVLGAPHRTNPSWS